MNGCTGEIMIRDVLQDEKIDTDADANLKGIGMQKIRATKRLLEALKEGKKGIFCTIEHIDDVLQVDTSRKTPNYTAEQNKSYSSDFSMNSHEVKNSLRIFFDNWYGIVEESESIQFVFYTNVSIAKEKKVGVLRDISKELPEKPLIQMLINKEYEQAFPFVLPIFKEYYLSQHKKHTKNILSFQKILDSMTEDKWKKFFSLIEWNFDKKTEVDLRNDVEGLAKELCIKFDVDIKYVKKIVAQILDMVESRTFNSDYLDRIVHVGEIKSLFLECAQEVKLQEKLDPMHAKWDEIKCDDIRNIRDKLLNVCPDFDIDCLEELEEEYIDGSYEQIQQQVPQKVKAFNYRIYKVCKRLIKKVLSENMGGFKQFEIENIIEFLTDEAEKIILDKAKTYEIAFEDRDMIRKTILILFQECYLAFDEKGGM